MPSVPAFERRRLILWFEGETGAGILNSDSVQNAESSPSQDESHNAEKQTLVILELHVARSLLDLHAHPRVGRELGSGLGQSSRWRGSRAAPRAPGHVAFNALPLHVAF